MKRRIALVVVGVAVLGGVLGIEPARADFHGLCTTGSSPAAWVRMTVSGSTLTYTGLVNCVGRSVTIDSLTFTALDANGKTSDATLSASCTACTAPISVTGTYTLPGPGTYSAYMAFTVTGVPQRFRTQRAVGRGPGQALTVICGGTDKGDQQIACPVPEGLATGLPAAESAAPDLDH